MEIRVAGTELSSREFDELAEVVDCEEAGTPPKDIGERRIAADPSTVAVYCSLKEKKLVSGLACDNTFWLHGSTPQGKSAVKDWRDKLEADEKALKDSRRHDYLVQAFGAAAAFLLGMVAEHWLGIVKAIATITAQ